MYQQSVSDLEAQSLVSIATSTGSPQLVADFARGAVQSESISAMGSSGIYRSDLPSGANALDLSDIYEVTAASNSRYSVSITMTTGSPSGGSYPQYYWGYFVQTGASILNSNGTPGGGY